MLFIWNFWISRPDLCRFHCALHQKLYQKLLYKWARKFWLHHSQNSRHKPKSRQDLLKFLREFPIWFYFLNNWRHLIKIKWWFESKMIARDVKRETRKLWAFSLFSLMPMCKLVSGCKLLSIQNGYSWVHKRTRYLLWVSTKGSLMFLKRVKENNNFRKTYFISWILSQHC